MLEHLDRDDPVEPLVGVEPVHVLGHDRQIGQPPRPRLAFDMFALAVAVRHRRDPRPRIGLGHPQRQRTPAAAHLKDGLPVRQIGVSAGLQQGRDLGLVQRLRSRRIQAARIFQPFAQAQAEELWRQFVVLGVGGVGVFGDGAPGHFRGEGGFVVRAVLVQPPARLRHQAVDGRAGDDVRERRVLKLTDRDIGQVHRRL